LLQPSLERLQIIEWDMSGPAPVRTIDIVVTPVNSVTRLVNLAGVKTRLVQSLSLGFEGVAGALPPGHVFSNASTVHETSTAELTLALMLASQRKIPEFVRQASSGELTPRFSTSLADRQVLVIGYGGVGRAIESRLKPFEVSIVRVARTARTSDAGQIFAVDALNELLPTADIVVIAVPLTENTTHLVNHNFLSCMPDRSLLVNVSRGKVVDTTALLAHAINGRLRFALDVVDPEPLPRDHPLLALDNVLITPHVGGASSAMMPRMAQLLNTQIERMMQGQPPVNVVLRT
jgi:phosphoglycerate dehydrogenase-like enzyme